MRGTTVICWIRDFGFFSQLEVKIFTYILFCHFFYSACQRNTKILPPEDEE